MAEDPVTVLQNRAVDHGVKADPEVYRCPRCQFVTDRITHAYVHDHEHVIADRAAQGG